MSGKSKNDLRGFEEVLDLVNKKKRGQREEKIGAEYDIQSFLEMERERLDKTYSFLKVVSKIFNQHPQTAPLISKSENEISEKENILIKSLTSEKSFFIRNLNSLFDSFYPKS